MANINKSMFEGSTLLGGPSAAAQLTIMGSSPASPFLVQEKNMQQGVPTTFVDSIVTVARPPRGKNEPMPIGFQPGQHDVICGSRGKQVHQHNGNRWFRIIIAMNVPKYLKASSKLEKTLLVMSIVDTIRDLGGSFVRRRSDDPSSWVEIGDQLAREKVGHALRDTINALNALEQETERPRALLQLIGTGDSDSLRKKSIASSRRRRASKAAAAVGAGSPRPESPTSPSSPSSMPSY